MINSALETNAVYQSTKDSIDPVLSKEYKYFT